MWGDQMNTSSHVLMGRFVYEYVKKKFGIYLDRESFISGNVLPDFRPSFLTRPHYLKNNISYVQKEVQNLLSIKQESAFIGKSYSKHLGIICHYYADFFCFAHNHNSLRDIVPHMKYENGLLQYLQKNHAILNRTDFVPEAEKNIDADMIYHKFNKLHTDYLQANPSYDNDLNYCILACVEAIALITNSSVIEMTDDLQLFYSVMQAI